MVGGTVKTIPSKVIQTQMLSRVLCLQLLWRTLRCPGIERDSFCLTGPSLLSRATRPARSVVHQNRVSGPHPGSPRCQSLEVIELGFGVPFLPVQRDLTRLSTYIYRSPNMGYRLSSLDALMWCRIFVREP